jgi:hypothetical protein
MKKKLIAVLAIGLFMSCVIGGANGATVNHWIESPDIANVIYSENSDGNVEISFSGFFDFTSLNGNVETFSGNFLYENGDPPFSLSTTDGVVHAHYWATPVNFSIFGSQLDPINATIYLFDGVGDYNDGFYFQVTLDYYDGNGIQIPNTNYGLVSMGLNAGAYPPNVLTDYEVPRNLNVMESITNQAGLWANVNPVPIPGAVWLLGLGLVGLAGTRMGCGARGQVLKN